MLSIYLFLAKRTVGTFYVLFLLLKVEMLFIVHCKKNWNFKSIFSEEPVKTQN